MSISSFPRTPAFITKMLRLTLILSLLLAFITLPSRFGHWIEPTALAASTTYTVTNTNDAGPGSLAEAIVRANFNPGADTIMFDLGPSAQTITLLHALPVIVDDVTITGPGANLLTIKRSTESGTPDFRILAVNSRSVNISGLTVSNGKTPVGNPGAGFGGRGGDGGGIFNGDGTLTLADIVVTGNSTGNGGNGGSTTGGFGGFGGGISSGGTLTMSNVLISNNTTGSGASGPQGGTGGGGGGIYFGGDLLTMNNCIVRDNVTGTGANGTNGGLSGGAGGYGAGLYIGSGTLSMTNVIISGNRVGDGASFGSTGGVGGGIFTYLGVTATLTNCTINNNSSGQGGSGFATEGGNGGGIENNGPMNMIGCTISGNFTKGPSASGGASGGGIFNNNVLTMTNCTVSGNYADLDRGRSGGIYHNGSTLTLTNCTITGNLAGNSSFQPGWGIYSGRTTNITNSIVAGNGNGAGFDVSGSFTSQGHNIIGKSDSSDFTDRANGDQVGTSASPLNPLLAPLANYGGLTQTHALLPGSPAIDAGDPANAPAQDQRGVSRVGVPDIGSFESRGFTVTATNGTPQSTQITTAFSSLLSAMVMSVFSEPVVGGQLIFTAPTSGASGTFAGNVTATVSVNGNGVATAPTFTANGTTGGYSVLASLGAGSPSATFNLTNIKANQLITFSSISDKTFGDAPFTINATASSGLPVTLSVLSGPAIINGNNLTITGVGMVTLRAAQAGNDNYNPAANSDQSFTVFPATTSASISSSQNPSEFNETVTFTATISSTPSGAGTPAGAVVFSIDGTSQSTITLINGKAQLAISSLSIGTHSVNVSYGGATNFAQSSTALPNGQVVTKQPIRLKFDQSSYSVSEGSGQITVNVLRTGDTSVPVKVDYATADITASDRSDYTLASSTLSFAAGETSKSISVLINEDSYMEGVETFSISLSNVTGGSELSAPSTATVFINDDDFALPTANAIDDAQTFVHQHYHDFLNREPDQAGLNYWTNQIASCNGDAQCLNFKRVSVSAAYFIELEFQETGSYLYRFYKASYGQQPTYQQFMPDRGRVVGGADLEAGKQAFADQWVQRPEFLTKYPLSLAAGNFVDQLMATVKATTGNAVDLSGNRAVYLNTLQTHGRGAVVRQIAEEQAFQTAEYNRAFVLMQYFGYLRRDPDQAGYQFWLDVLNNRVANNYRGMVCAFITSAEYQDRFSSVRTRNDSVCSQVGPQ